MTQAIGPGPNGVKQQITHARVWRLAAPIMIANVSQPLLGMVDAAVVGHLPHSFYLGAVAVGAMIFNFIYWGFGFLRMGTSGFTAQAFGAGDGGEVRAGLARALLVATVIGMIVIALQVPVATAAFFMVEGSDQVENLARDYFSIRVWGAPAALANYALLGWFVGLQNTRAALILQLVLNGSNIALDLLFVFGLGWGVEGVALATLIAEFLALAVAVPLASRQMHALGRRFHGKLNWSQVWLRSHMRRLLSANSNIFIRTLFLILGFAMFTAAGARAGDDILAANMVALNLISISSFALDGFAHSAQALVGSAFGARDRVALRQAVRLNALWGLLFALGFSLVFLLFGKSAMALITSVPQALAMAHEFLPWVVITPPISVWCFLLDGVFIGAMRDRDMRNAMLWSFVIYLAALYGLPPWLGNHGLWLALLIFFAVRGVTLAWRYPALLRSLDD